MGLIVQSGSNRVPAICLMTAGCLETKTEPLSERASAREPANPPRRRGDGPMGPPGPFGGLLAIFSAVRPNCRHSLRGEPGRPGRPPQETRSGGQAALGRPVHRGTFVLAIRKCRLGRVSGGAIRGKRGRSSVVRPAAWNRSRRTAACGAEGRGSSLAATTPRTQQVPPRVLGVRDFARCPSRSIIALRARSFFTTKGNE